MRRGRKKGGRVYLYCSLFATERRRIKKINSFFKTSSKNTTPSFHYSFLSWVSVPFSFVFFFVLTITLFLPPTGKKKIFFFSIHCTDGHPCRRFVHRFRTLLSTPKKKYNNTSCFPFSVFFLSFLCRPRKKKQDRYQEAQRNSQSRFLDDRGGEGGEGSRAHKKKACIRNTRTHPYFGPDSDRN